MGFPTFDRHRKKPKLKGINLHTVDPLLVFAFLQTFTETLKEYLGEISIATLKDHFDVIHQLLEEMLDEGQPLTTELNALKDIVIPPSLFNKVLSVAGAVGLAKTATASTPFASPIPWRKTGLRYNHNEILFDISEQLDAIVNKSVLFFLLHSPKRGNVSIFFSFPSPHLDKGQSYPAKSGVRSKARPAFQVRTH